MQCSAMLRTIPMRRWAHIELQSNQIESNWIEFDSQLKESTSTKINERTQCEQEQGKQCPSQMNKELNDRWMNGSIERRDVRNRHVTQSFSILLNSLKWFRTICCCCCFISFALALSLDSIIFSIHHCAAPIVCLCRACEIVFVSVVRTIKIFVLKWIWWMFECLNHQSVVSF